MERRYCEVCGREAIGLQIMGCCHSFVCEEHAEPMLRELKPGELKEWGVCCFQRFAETSSDEREPGKDTGEKP
ncbi:MAG: hypothetical protein LUQ42_04515 [Methanomicrobiales archaeon]|jgi:hypothetical protein|nr:hypothetical protein [Methanomicrobiales archaeon]MDD1647104.1 hypothetical protein [Methanomicrobiales archaeon]MDD1648529.1 hypothetical protein [Methanomicrobiales archaeon]